MPNPFRRSKRDPLDATPRSISRSITASSILTLAVLLLVWGAISFHSLPVEAYPDVANNYVQVITQWPGRAAEEVEQQVTIPHRNSDERDAAPARICAPFRFSVFPA